jgi:predicted aconitase with swiveling domain
MGSLRRRWLIARLVIVTASAAAMLLIQAPTEAATKGSASTLDVVGGPIAVGTTAVVVSVDSRHILHLDGVDPVTNNLVWQHPYSASAITPDVALTPAAAGSTVADLVPAVSAGNPVVVLAGVNATTGATEWQAPGEAVVTDNPASCDAGQAFCVPVFNSDGSSTSLAVINSSTGIREQTISGSNRAIAAQLYETDTQPPTFQQISPTGSLAWTKPISAIFGSGYDPNYGWDIDAVGSLNVGTVAPVSGGKTLDLAAFKTVGFSVANGAPQWTLPGSYQCMGPLAVLSTQVVCQYSGTAHYSKPSPQSTSLKGVSLNLLGFNPSSGATSWSVRVSDVRTFVFGDGLQFIDGTHVMIQNAAGKIVVLDTSTGSTTSIKTSQVTWCQKIPTYRVVAIKGTPEGGMRGGSPVFFPCTTSGDPSAAAPPSSPSTIGTTMNGMFVWASPSGLRTHPVAGAHVSA